MADDEGVAQSNPAEDINDKLLLDLAWERQQKKTFTAWCNSHLRKVGANISEIDVDFRNGLLLLKLLELISGETVSPAEKKGKMRIHKVSNVSKALSFIASKGVKLVGIGAEEIVDGNLKMTLGMIWTIILRFAIQDISVEELSAKEGLLLWCQRKTAPYKNVNVQNFHVSFKDGLAFCALIHRHRPDLLDYDSLKKSDDMYNLNLAFDIAEKHLDIPKMLDAEDIHSTVKPDERAIMTYVSSYYHAFASGQQAETAANRIGKALNVNKENENMMEVYEQMASDLLEWIEKTLPWLNDRTPETILEDTKSRMEEFRLYSAETKPPKEEEKGKLEAHFHTLQTKLRLSGRPAYVPSEGRLVTDIASAWKTLETAEKLYLLFLTTELQRLKRLEMFVQRFERKAMLLEKTFEEDNTYLSNLTEEEIAGANLAGIMAKKNIHDAFETDLTAQEGRVTQLQATIEELASLNYHDIETIQDHFSRIKQSLEDLHGHSDNKKSLIEEAIANQHKLDELRLDFAKRANELNNAIESITDDLHESFSCSTVKEAEELIQEFEEKKSEIDEINKLYAAFEELEKQLTELGSTENLYTVLTLEDMNKKREELFNTCEQYQGSLEAELEKQRGHEELRLRFAEMANKLGPYIEEKKAELIDLEGNTDDLLEATKAFQASVISSEEKELLDKAEHLHQEMQAALIFINPHTTCYMENLRSGWSQLLVNINRSINVAENEILVRDSKGINDEQLKDYRTSFNHFDKDKSGMLDKNEFRSCLLSLGYKLGSDPTNDPTYEKLWNEVDPNETGFVDFAVFLDFMTKETVDKDTAEQVLESFKILAGDKPFITAQELQKELPADQAEYCIKRMAPYTGEGAVEGALDYRSFSSALYGQSEL